MSSEMKIGHNYSGDKSNDIYNFFKKKIKESFLIFEIFQLANTNVKTFNNDIVVSRQLQKDSNPLSFTTIENIKFNIENQMIKSIATDDFESNCINCEVVELMKRRSITSEDINQEDIYIIRKRNLANSMKDYYNSINHLNDDEFYNFPMICIFDYDYECQSQKFNYNN